MLRQGKTDAFGAAAMAYSSKGESVTVLLLHDNGKQESFEMSHYYGEFFQLDEDILREARGRVLDIGCGAGRFALYLQERGFDVVGIDESPLAIEICKQRGIKECYVMDARTLQPTDLGLFDTVIFMGSNVGIGGTPEGVRSILAVMHQETSQQSRILFSIGGALPHDLQTDAMRSEQQDNLARHGYVGQRRFRVVFEDYDTGEFDWIIPTLDDLRAWAEQAGWRVTKVLFGPDSRGLPGRMAGVMEKIASTESSGFRPDAKGD